MQQQRNVLAGMALAISILSGCQGQDGSSAQTSPTPINSDRVREVVDQADSYSMQVVMEHLTGVTPAPLSSGEVRIAERGSESGRRTAAQYMRESFEAMGLSSRILEFRSASGKRGFNVEAVLNGSPGGRHLFVSAHLDSVSNAGASDDASGLTSLLMTARALKSMQPRDTIHFLAFDLEEIGLVGSAQYVSTEVARIQNTEGKRAILGNLHSDMIGYDDGSNRGVVGTCGDGGPVGAAVLRAAEWLRSTITMEEDCLGRSDHQNFWDAGHAAALLTDASRYDDYPWYHLPSDTIDKIDFPYLQNMIQNTIASVLILAFPEEVTS